MPRRRSRRRLPRDTRKADRAIRKELRWCRIKWATFEAAIALWKIRGQDRGRPDLGDVLWFISRVIWDEARREEHRKRMYRRRTWRANNAYHGIGAIVMSGDYKNSRRSFIRKRRK